MGTIGKPDLTADEKFETNLKHSMHHDEMLAGMEESIAKKDTDEWVDILEQAGIPCSAMNVDKVISHTQVLAR